jgi:hypothetical protein
LKVGVDHALSLRARRIDQVECLAWRRFGLRVARQSHWPGRRRQS